MVDWIIIRTDHKVRHSESKVYHAVITGMECEAWLPIEPRFTRVPGAKHKRQWWGCILPNMFFAAVPRDRFHELRAIKDYMGYDKDSMFQPLTMPEAAIDAFRTAIERENRELMRMARNHDEKPSVGPGKRKYSKKLRRGKVAQELHDKFSSPAKIIVDDAA